MNLGWTADIKEMLSVVASSNPRAWSKALLNAFRGHFRLIVGSFFGDHVCSSKPSSFWFDLLSAFFCRSHHLHHICMYASVQNGIIFE